MNEPIKERPILFSAPMVLALLAGTKTQTRRVAKLTDTGRLREVGSHRNWHPDDPNASLASPYGQPGERIWVKETWGTRYDFDGLKPTLLLNPSETKHGAEIYFKASDFNNNTLVLKSRPSIFMCRWMSRITLEITSVRVERLNDISEVDARAEGCDFDEWTYPQSFTPGKTSYRVLWESINGAGSWDKNDWLWVIKFKRVLPK